jgi:hypothetical protein
VLDLYYDRTPEPPSPPSRTPALYWVRYQVLTYTGLITDARQCPRPCTWPRGSFGRWFDKLTTGFRTGCCAQNDRFEGRRSDGKVS